mmetsp:Transcript_41294/g.124948  ORF Transcript_41294/g.124948 Transcript_41294/m.124948 type:complete len:230 (-) Transcript_41294:246-935(-)
MRRPGGTDTGTAMSPAAADTPADTTAVAAAPAWTLPEGTPPPPSPPSPRPRAGTNSVPAGVTTTTILAPARRAAASIIISGGMEGIATRRTIRGTIRVILILRGTVNLGSRNGSRSNGSNGSNGSRSSGGGPRTIPDRGRNRPVSWDDCWRIPTHSTMMMMQGGGGGGCTAATAAAAAAAAMSGGGEGINIATRRIGPVLPRATCSDGIGRPTAADHPGRNRPDNWDGC